MKKTSIFYLMMFFLGLSFSFTSCSDDDDIEEPTICPTDNQTAAEWITGTYDGTMGTVLSSANFNNLVFPDTMNQKVIITHDSINHVTVTYKDWTNGGTNYGDLIISSANATIAADGQNILVNGTCKQTLYKEGRGFEADLTLQGSITEKEKLCNLIFTVHMPVSPMMTLDFKLTYNGKPE